MIPLLIAGAVVGLGAHAYASVDNNEAREKNIRANEIIEESTKVAQEANNLCQTSIGELARVKKAILQGNMKRFVKSFSKIKPVNFNNTSDIFEIAKFNKNELTTIQSMVNNVQKINVNDVVGGVSGTALAVGAADMLAGGSILGGTGITVGGLAGGAAVGAIAAPIFAITGIFSAAEASENLEKAKSNLARAKAYQDECETYSCLAQAVSERCDLYYETLVNINKTWFSDAVYQLELLVNRKRTFTNFWKNLAGEKIYTREEMQMVASVAALAKMVKTLIDTNILDKNGQVSDESEKMITLIQDEIRNKDLTVRVPQPQYINPQQVYTQPQNVYSQQVYIQPQNVNPQQVYIQPQNVNPQQVYTQPQNVNPQQVYIQPKNVYPQQQNNYLQQNINNQVQNTNNGKILYNPNGFVKFIMWSHTVFYGLCGLLLIIGGAFISGCFMIAAGLMMCPKMNKTMKFWPRFWIMFGMLVICVLVF